MDISLEKAGHEEHEKGTKSTKLKPFLIKDLLQPSNPGQGASSEANTHRTDNEGIAAVVGTPIGAFRLRLNPPYALLSIFESFVYRF
ncbi:MAG: hypothetical protein KGY48_01270 [Wenzhouxiangellaceae bacterium]|nr:hypothetical protein [Wenzhouxiangellaceae bacterium]MBS3746511.1 hypothetical protein [Wenzhouxiangellaceae bacterium]